MADKLSESRLIELSTLVDFYGEDLSYLKSILEEAGQGRAGNYEKYRLDMAAYMLRSAKDYLEWVVNEALGFTDPDAKEPKVTFITPEGTAISPSKKDQQLTIPKKPWVPPFKDEDKITKIIKEVLEDVTDKDKAEGGFVGWLAASVTAVCDGKADIAVVLRKIEEILNV